MQTNLLLSCEKCSQRNYRTSRGKKTENKLSLKKYCKFCYQHTLHKERSVK